MASRCVAVTGATGFIGRRLTRRLSERGWRVRAIVRPGGATGLDPGIERIEARLAPDEIARACAGADALVHLAGRTRAATARGFDAVNVEGTRAAAHAATASGARLVYVSSLAAAGPGTPERPRAEEDAPAPVTPYGESKLAGERIVRRMPGATWTIVRPALVYGPGDRNFLPLFRLAARGLALAPGSTRAAYTLIHVDDVADGIAAVLDAPAARGETFFLGHPEPATVETMHDVLARLAGHELRRLRVPWPLVELAATLGHVAGWCGARAPLDRYRLTELRAPGWVCRVDRAERVGFRARIPLETGFAATHSAYREAAWV